MDPFTIVTGLASAGVAVSREIREWLNGRRQRIEAATDISGQLIPLGHHGGALMAPPAMLSPAQIPATLDGSFEPADGVAARRLRQTDQALVLVWPSGANPQDSGIVFTSDLGGGFALELAGGYLRRGSSGLGRAT